MAQSLSFFGNRRGSTKSHTYQVNGGLQITKDRVEEVKNPRTNGQMLHRCLISSMANAGRLVQAILPFGFEGGQDVSFVRNAYRKAQYSLLRQCAVDSPEATNFALYGQQSPLLTKTIISEGSLPRINYSVTRRSISLGYNLYSITLLSSSESKSVRVWCDKIGIGVGDSFFIAVVGLSRDLKEKLFGFCEFRCKKITDDDFNTNNFLEFFAVKNYGAVSYASIYAAGTRQVRFWVSCSSNDYVDNISACQFIRKKVRGKWLVSNSYINSLSQSFITQPLSVALATYPQGGGNVLDGGAV